MDLDSRNNLSLIRKKKIDIKKLNKNQYIVSLIQEALRNGVMNNQEVLNIQIKIMGILKELILKYTKGESTSVTTDITESLLNSILYALDFYLLNFDEPQAAIMDLRQKSINKMYEDGIELLRLCVEETKKLYGKVKKNRLKVELEAYNATIDEAIPSFFEKYSVVFEVHNTMASIDYPLVFDDMSVRGISYIKNYLEHLDIETEFCRLFSEEDINKIISGFGRMCRLNHKIELINIFELLINNSIFSVLCGNNARELNISRSQYNMLKEKLDKIDFSNLNPFIDKAIEAVIKDLSISNPLALCYIDNYKELLVKRIQNALENDSLSSLIVINEEKEKDKFIFAFDEGNRIGEKRFRIIVNRIMKISETKEKVNVVNSNINSLQDFIDILNADCFFGEEFELLFSTLGDIELTILTKIVFYEELRDGLTDLPSIIMSKREAEAEWQEYFIEFIEKLNSDRMKRIEDLLNKVDYEEIKFN